MGKIHERINTQIDAKQEERLILSLLLLHIMLISIWLLILLCEYFCFARKHGCNVFTAVSLHLLTCAWTYILLPDTKVPLNIAAMHTK